jgi:hypothetical protein
VGRRGLRFDSRIVDNEGFIDARPADQDRRRPTADRRRGSARSQSRGATDLGARALRAALGASPAFVQRGFSAVAPAPSDAP